MRSDEPADEPDDWELLFAWFDGDARASERLGARYYGLLMRFFLNKTRDAEDAADLVSETLLACVASKGRVTRSGAFRSYLFAIAMNKLRTYYRTQVKRRRELDDFAELCVATAYPRSPPSMLARAQEARLLVKALRRLSLAQQMVVELSYFEGLRGREIAELLGVPASTVRTHLERGRKRLIKITRELADSPELATSTISGLSTWVQQIRERVGLPPEGS
ncbi:MAG: sigma-70 family RNA polymerase sigma factor [Myxococcales bacterium]|nr:sigma-70 family RNA polymerase sigma factor [Myxococcales bacterium]